MYERRAYFRCPFCRARVPFFPQGKGRWWYCATCGARLKWTRWRMVAPCFVGVVPFLPLFVGNNPGTWLHSLFTVALLAALILGSSWVVGRPRPGKHCERCGYDLRTHSGRCPECGLAVGGTEAAREDRSAGASP